MTLQAPPILDNHLASCTQRVIEAVEEITWIVTNLNIKLIPDKGKRA